MTKFIILKFSLQNKKKLYIVKQSLFDKQKMEVQQKIPQQSSTLSKYKPIVENILKDPKKYRKMMLILQQTLYDLGYHQSAQMLQNQSGISYYTQQLKQIKQNLQKNDFQTAIKVIQSLQLKNNSNHSNHQNHKHITTTNHRNHNNVNGQNHLNNLNHKQKQKSSLKIQRSILAQTKNMIYQTYCIQKIINKDFQAAMNIINQYIQSQNKKEALCQALVLGNLELTEQEFNKKKQQIFKFCLSQYQEIGQRQIEKVIQSYTQSQGEYNKELKNLLCGNKKFPPMKILSSQAHAIIKNSITHIKINPLTQQLLIIDQNKDSQQLLLFKINKKNWKYQKQISQTGHLSLKLKYPIFTFVNKKSLQFVYKSKKQSIQSVSWNKNKQYPLIAIASFSIIHLINKNLQTVKTIQAQNKIQKFLHLEFNSFSDLLYVCGYFQCMNVFDTAGEQIMSIYPYPKVRKFLFYNNNSSEIIGISLVTNKIYKHSIDEQVLVKDKQFDDGVAPMDLCLSQDQRYLCVSSLQFIYVLDPKSLNILGKTVSPSNPNKCIIQLNFYGDFLISLCKTFIAYELKEDKMTQQQNGLLITKIKQWLGQGTFSTHNQFMISGLKYINCWEQGNLECEMNSDSEYEEEIQDQIVDIENQDEEMLSDSDDDSNSLDDQSMEDQDEGDVQIM